MAESILVNGTRANNMAREFTFPAKVRKSTGSGNMERE